MPRANSEPAPLSFAQERLWFLEQLEPQIAVYNICRASRLFGNLSIPTLEASLNEIVSRHETLRTAFRLINGRPVQVVEPSRNISIEYLDLRAIPDGEREAEIRRRIKAESECPFDLSAGLLLRSILLRARDREHVLILLTHHSVVDAWSMAILTREIWTLYEAFSNGKPSPLERLPVQYSDYAVWQRNWLQGEVLDTQLDYWKKQLQDFTILNLPTDRPRTPRQSFRSARAPLVLPADLTRSVNDLSNRYAVTPFMTLLAAFQVLLHRYTGQEDVVIGSPVANRRRPEIETLIGFFVNTLVLRAKLSGTPSFGELLLRVRDICVAAYANQDMPFEKLVQQLKPERDLSLNPFFQVMFVLQNATSPFSGYPGLRVEPIELETSRSPVDLSLFLREREKKYIGYIEYSTDLFARDRIERMIGHYQTLLEAIIANPDQSIVTLPILTKAERRQILVEWNDTTVDYPKDKCIHQLFEEQVERTPDAIALEYRDKQLTYRELNSKANQLAHNLINLGVGLGRLVGICVERSLEMVIGLLGILKAGGAYVPLDPTYPKDRIAFMLEDSNALVLLTSGKLLSNFPDYGGVSVTLDDALFAPDQKDGNPCVRTKATDPAYVIYTSGSTGTPKGVVGLHQGAINRMAWMWRAYPFGANEKSCIKTSLSFVDSVWELFGPLLQGVPNLIIPDDIVKDIRSLVRTLSDYRVTRIVLVPSLLRAILDEWPNLEKARLHKIIWTSSGERLPTALIDEFHRKLPNSVLLNLYGSSEVSGDVTGINVRDSAEGTPISIGRPISNTRIYLFDPHGQLVPIGVTGEIYVGGPGLARGYLNRPELTAEKFVINPFGGESDRRIYRTGDLARYLPDGNIEFLGRADNQVKIRGHRIELGEIESVLNQHATVRESAVLAQDEISEEQRGADHPESQTRTEQSRSIENLEYDKRLIAFVVPSQHSSAPVSELRDFLKQKLPDYMVPWFFVPVDALPLTANGKIDRKALPRPNLSRPELDQVYVEPKSEIEELVAQAWRDALKLDKVGGADNFFELGGHSLLAVQIVSRLRGVLGHEIPLRALFEAPTLAALSNEIESIVRHGRTQEPPPITCQEGGGAAPLSLSQEQLWHLDRLIPDTSMFNMFFVFELTGSLNVEALQSALAEIVRRHGALRTVFSVGNNQPVQIIKEPSEFQLGVADLRAGASSDLLERVAGLILRESSRPFELTVGPLFRTQLLKLADHEHLLLISLHHIISDQWSMRLFRSELATLYDAFSRRRTSSLPIPPIRFTDYARWQRQMLNAGLWDGQLRYWRKQLGGRLSMLRFAGAREKTISLSFRVARQSFEFGEDRLAVIKELARQEASTPYMVVLTALNILLHFYTGQRDLRVGALMANRSRQETENVMGPFLNTTIVRTKLSPDRSIKKLLKQIRDTTVAAQANQEVPLEHLVRTFGWSESPYREALCQVLCNYQNLADEPLAMPGLKIAFWNRASLGAEPNVMFTTFDLIFHFRQTSTRLSLTVNYKAEVFGKRMISGLIENFDRILKAITGRPGGVLSSVLAGARLQRPRVSHRRVQTQQSKERIL